MNFWVYYILDFFSHVLYIFIPIILPICLISIIFGHRLTRKSDHLSDVQPKPSNRWRIIVSLTASLCCLSLGMLLYCAWFQGDDWEFHDCLPLRTDILRAGWRYLHWVSRGGEIFLTIVQLSFNRWQAWILVPLITAAAPFAFYALLKPKEASIYSATGFRFYVFMFCLCLLGVYLPSWRNYWCFAAACNYLFPTVLTVWFLSYFRSDMNDARNGKALCILLFLAGCLSGWGTECMTAILLPLLTIRVAYNIIRKKRDLPLCSYYGYAGFLCGAFLLFASPALSTRSQLTAESLHGKLSGMNETTMDCFLNHLDDSAMESLRGGADIIYLKSFPLLKHYHFVPYISKLFLCCCCIAGITWIVLSLITLTEGRNGIRKVLYSTIFTIIAFFMAWSYLYACIPTHMSFLPPCFIVVAAAGYLFLRTRYNFCRTLVTTTLVGIAMYIFVPAGIEAWEYKHYEKARMTEIRRQISEGNKDIRLPKPYPVKPKDPLGLISKSDLKSDSKKYPNSSACKPFGVDSITQDSDE